MKEGNPTTNGHGGWLVATPIWAAKERSQRGGPPQASESEVGASRVGEEKRAEIASYRSARGEKGNKRAVSECIGDALINKRFFFGVPCRPMWRDKVAGSSH